MTKTASSSFFAVARLVVLGRARILQGISGSSSDNDRERTLREGQNTARGRSGDDDSLLAGALLLPPVMLGRITRALSVAMVTTSAGLGAAMVMMMMMTRPRGGGGDKSMGGGALTDDGPLALLMARAPHAPRTGRPGGR